MMRRLYARHTRTYLLYFDSSEESFYPTKSNITTETFGKALAQSAEHTGFGEKMVASQPTLWDLEARFRIMDRHDDYIQVILIVGSPIKSIAEPKKSCRTSSHR